MITKSKTVLAVPSQTVGPNTGIAGDWIPCKGWDKIAVTVASDAVHNLRASIQWSHDGVNVHGETYTTEFIPQQNSQYREGETGVKADYCRVRVFNLDASVNHVMTAWAYFKST